MSTTAGLFIISSSPPCMVIFSLIYFRLIPTELHSIPCFGVFKKFTISKKSEQDLMLWNYGVKKEQCSMRIMNYNLNSSPIVPTTKNRVLIRTLTGCSWLWHRNRKRGQLPLHQTIEVKQDESLEVVVRRISKLLDGDNSY